MIQIEEQPAKGNGETSSVDLLDPLRPLRSDRLAIVGFSETTRHLAPFDDPSVEIWICNRLGLQDGITRWDRHMDPHPLAWSKNNHKTEDWRTYKEWFALDHGSSMVYLPAPDPEVADVQNVVSFPTADVIAEVKREYFASAIGWQLGLALLLHSRYGAPTRIELYGIDLRAAAEYEFQRPNAEWLLGIAEGRGIEIVIPGESALLNQDGRSPLYGFELYSGFMGETEKALEERSKEIGAKLVDLSAQNEKILKEMHEWHGAQQECVNWHRRVAQFRRGGKL